jgi:hypothetical protein
MKTVHYGGKTARVESAAGLRGILCRFFGGKYFLRVPKRNGKFTDFELRHSDLEIIIPRRAEGAVYRIGRDYMLDHSPETLGLTKPRKKRRHTTESVAAQRGRPLGDAGQGGCQTKVPK